MAGLIIVDRGDGRAVAGLLTSLLANWERIPVSVQAAIIKHATEAAFESAGRTDGGYVVTSFILKHRTIMMREARWQPRKERGPGGVRNRAREAVDLIAARRRAAMRTAARLVKFDLRGMIPGRQDGVLWRWWTGIMPRRPIKRRAA